MKSARIAIFASGSGSNAENIARYFSNNTRISVKLILSNKPDAYVIERAKKMNIPALVFTRQEFYESDKVLQYLNENNIDWIVLAGFLWLIPVSLLEAYPKRIVNIHPALLPKYGGKGMYGKNVHQAVIDNRETESGITIHYVNQDYDKGNIIFQAGCKVNPSDTAESLAIKVHDLEYAFFPKVVEKLIDASLNR